MFLESFSQPGEPIGVTRQRIVALAIVVISAVASGYGVAYASGLWDLW